MRKCTYCGTPLCGPDNEPSADHVFPEFLGGHKTVPACRRCNSMFGHTFEAQAAQLLVRPYVQLAKWGVPLPGISQWWRSALQVEGAVVDLSVDKRGIRARAERPIIGRDEDGKITEAFFSRESDLRRFVETVKMRRPEEQWHPAEKRVATDLQGLRMQFEFGTALQQLALKICLGGARLLNTVDPEHLSAAGQVLRSQLADVHPLVSHYFRRYPAIDAVRPSLAHTLYVEHHGRRLIGLVQFFGVFQAFCDLSREMPTEGDCALLAWVDPVELKENFRDIPRAGIADPPHGYHLSEIINAQLEWTALLHAGAVHRGATGDLDVVVRAGMPRQP